MTFIIPLLSLNFTALLVALIWAVFYLREISVTLPHIRYALEDQIRADIDHAEPECARCGAECTNPPCVEAVRNR